MAITMDKTGTKEHFIKYWFIKRHTAAVEEYREVIKGTPYEKQTVYYRGTIFNPLSIKPRDITGLYAVPEGSPHAEKLDRYIRLIDDQTKVTGILTSILRFVDTMKEFNYVVFDKDSPARKEELDEFKVSMGEELRYLRKIRLLSDMV